ncbi:hypothetical protein F5Y05DRAFT_129377 [Hypoxylon sp. FL0543]|nr:hypothetical protein F5Y05DRAFT_129377 [Hypoxylon sp. FL0543]
MHGSYYDKHSVMSTSKAHELQLWRTASQASRFSQPSQAQSTVNLGNTSPLIALPWELQLSIISHLDVRGALQLRQTCQLYFQHLTTEAVEKLFTEAGYITFDLLNCCIECFAMPPIGYLVLGESCRQNSWRSSCFRCWRVKRSSDYYLKPDRFITFVNGRTGHVCTFCGWPVCFNIMHPSCRRMVLAMKLVSWGLSVIHFSALILAITAAWIHYVEVPAVLIPATLNFFIAFGSLTLLTLDLLQDSNTTHSRLPMELTSTLLWMPAVVYAAQRISGGHASWNSYPAFICGLFTARLLTHALNVIGFGISSSGYDTRSPSLPGLSVCRRALYVVCSFLVYWASVKYR